MLNLFLMLLIGARDTLKQPGNEELNIAVVSIETTAHSNELREAFKKKREIVCFFTKRGGGSTPQPNYFPFFLVKFCIALK